MAVSNWRDDPRRRGRVSRPSCRPPDASRIAPALGRRRGGLTTQIVTLTDRNGKGTPWHLQPEPAAAGPERGSRLDRVPLEETTARRGDQACDREASDGMIAPMPPTQHRLGHRDTPDPARRGALPRATAQAQVSRRPLTRRSIEP